MKKQLLLGMSMLAFGLSQGQTIKADDLKWNVGNYWAGKTNSGSLDITPGTGKTWNLNSFVGAADTIWAMAAPTFDVKIKSSLLGEIDYKKSTGNFSVGTIYVSGAPYNVDNANSLSIGTPHTYGGTFTGSTTVSMVLQLMAAGEVIGSGIVTTSFGTFNCVMVKEVISGIYSREAYYIETVEYGRVAAYVKSSAKVWVVNAPIQVGTSAVKSSTFSVYPNPAFSALNVLAENGGSVKIFNALGNVVKQFVHSGGTMGIDISNLGSGMYFVQLSSDKGVQTKSIIVK